VVAEQVRAVVEADSAAQQALLELQVPALLLQFDEPEVVEQALDAVDDQLFDLLHDADFSDLALTAGAMPTKCLTLGASSPSGLVCRAHV
jgi:hypothetical protein